MCCLSRRLCPESLVFCGQCLEMGDVGLRRAEILRHVKRLAVDLKGGTEIRLCLGEVLSEHGIPRSKLVLQYVKLRMGHGLHALSLLQRCLGIHLLVWRPGLVGREYAVRLRLRHLCRLSGTEMSGCSTRLKYDVYGIWKGANWSLDVVSMSKIPLHAFPPRAARLLST